MTSGQAGLRKSPAAQPVSAPFWMRHQVNPFAYCGPATTVDIAPAGMIWIVAEVVEGLCLSRKFEVLRTESPGR